MAKQGKSGKERITEIGRELYPNFSIDQEPFLSMYKQVFEYFLELKSRPKFMRGLSLIGHKGSGKSSMMRIMQKVFADTPAQFKRVTTRELNLMLDEMTASEIMFQYGERCPMDLYIDDVGASFVKNNRYGTDYNILNILIEERYELFLKAGFVTHISTNNPINLSTEMKEKYPDVISIEDMYGDRVADRLYEMTKIFIFEIEESKRTKEYFK